MALSGNYTHYTEVPSETETVDVLITYPSNLEVDHPDYEKRGTTETIQQAALVEESTVYENIYLTVKVASLNVIEQTSDFKYVELSGFYRIYESEEARNLDKDNYLAEYYINKEFNFSEESNPYSSLYELIKSQRGAENLINA